MTGDRDEERELSLRDLFPDLTEEQLREAERNLDRYFEIALRVFNRLRSDPEALVKFTALTPENGSPRIPDKKSSGNKKLPRSIE